MIRRIPASVVMAVAGLALGMLAPSMLAAASVPGDGPAALASGQGSVVVNEFAPSHPDWQIHEFVELRNTSDKTVTLQDWQLVACLSPSTWRVAKVFGPDAMVSSGGHLLLTHPDYDDFTGPPPDHFYDVDLPEDGGWLLHDPWSGYADGVGLSSGFDCTEGGPAPKCNLADGEAAARDEQGKDTDDNAADFTCQPRTPGR